MSDRNLRSESLCNATGTPDLPPAAKPSIAASNAPTRPEYCEDYPHVVAFLSDGSRVIECSDGIQWAIQTHRPDDSNMPWRYKYFFRSKEGLLFYAPKPHPPELLALPDWLAA